MKIRICVLAVILTVCNPIYGKIQIVGDLLQERKALPGEVYSGNIRVYNAGDEQEEVRVYQTDYAFDKDGHTYYGEPGQLPRSNALWIKYSPKRLQIPAGSEMTIAYTVTLPDTSELRGTYWSILMVEPMIPESDNPEKKDRQMAVTTVFRYGIQIATHIGSSGTSRLQFQNPIILQDSTSRFFQFEIYNTGEQFLRSQILLDVYDMEGHETEHFKGPLFSTYPGCSKTVKMDVLSLPANVYRVVLIADCGGDRVFGIQYHLNIKML